MISREGRVIEIIPETLKASHAPPANQNSIGIELVDDFNGIDGSGTGHIENPNWATEIQLKKAAMLVRDITSRRQIDPYHLTTTAPGNYEHQVPLTAGITPNRSGIAQTEVGVLAHGQVLNRTAGRTDPQNFDWVSFMTRVNEGIGLTLNSPANLLVTDPLGRRVGVDSATGQILLEIPGATFSGAGAEPETLSIPGSIGGNYVVQVVGTATGVFHLDIDASGHDAGLTSTQVVDTTSAGLVTTYTLKYDAQKGENTRVVGVANLPPVAFDDGVYTNIGTPITIRPLANDSDPDGSLDPASLTIATPPASGSVSVDPPTGQITYVPGPVSAGPTRLPTRFGITRAPCRAWRLSPSS